MKRIQFSFFFATIFLSPFIVLAQQKNRQLDDYFLRNTPKAKIIGIQVASIGQGELVWRGSYGVKKYKARDAVNDSTLFMMASCSKPVTSLGIMKLYDQGKLDLDDDINDHLSFRISNPNCPKEKITIRMLLAHTSWLRDNWDVLNPLYTLPEGDPS